MNHISGFGDYKKDNAVFSTADNTMHTRITNVKIINKILVSAITPSVKFQDRIILSAVLSAKMPFYDR